MVHHTLQWINHAKPRHCRYSILKHGHYPNKSQVSICKISLMKNISGHAIVSNKEERQANLPSIV